LLSVLIGDAGIKILHKEPVDPHALTALINCERRALDALGALQRDPKLVDGHASGGGDPELARRLANTWPEFHEQEIARSARDADHMAAQIAALGDGDEPDNDEPSVQPRLSEEEP